MFLLERGYFDFYLLYLLKHFNDLEVVLQFIITWMSFRVVNLFAALFYLILQFLALEADQKSLRTHPFICLFYIRAHISFYLILKFSYLQEPRLVLVIFFRKHQCFSLHLLSFSISGL